MRNKLNVAGIYINPIQLLCKLIFMLNDINPVIRIIFVIVYIIGFIKIMYELIILTKEGFFTIRKI